MTSLAILYKNEIIGNARQEYRIHRRPEDKIWKTVRKRRALEVWAAESVLKFFLLCVILRLMLYGPRIATIETSTTSSYDITENTKKPWQPGCYSRAFIICLLSFIIDLKQNRQKTPEIPQEELSKSKRPPSLFILYVPEWIHITTSSQKGSQESMCLAFSASLREVGKQKR